MAQAPGVGTKVRLKVPVGNDGDPGRLEAGREGEVDEVVAAEVKGAGDDVRDHLVVAFPPDNVHVNGRRWSHPVLDWADVLEVI